MPKRRRMPFPSRVLYRHGSSSTHPAAVTTGVRRLPDTSTPPAAGASGLRFLPSTSTPAAAGASTSQPDSDESAEESESDFDDEDDDEEEVEIVGHKPVVTSGAVSLDLNKPVSKEVVQSGSGGSTSERVAAILSDTDVLDCAICFEPFTIPVYQVFSVSFAQIRSLFFNFYDIYMYI